MDDIERFSKLLQMSLVPGILISGVGLLLLSISNRLGRTIDRARELASEIREKRREENPETILQLQILIKRSEWLRASVGFVCGSIFFSTFMMVGLFLLVFFGAPLKILILAAFFISVSCLGISVLFFIMDVSIALRAMKLELAKHLGH